MKLSARQNESSNLVSRCRLNTAKAQISQARFNALALKIYALGPRPVAELLRELIALCDDEHAAMSRLERYAALPDAFIKANNGDRFVAPLTAVRGGRK